MQSISLIQLSLYLTAVIDESWNPYIIWILTLVDYATRYPEAIALKATDTETVAEALLVMFSRVGVPTVMVSDNGPQFVSNIMVEVARLLSIETIQSTPYHAMANGLVKRINDTLN